MRKIVLKDLVVVQENSYKRHKTITRILNDGK